MACASEFSFPRKSRRSFCRCSVMPWATTPSTTNGVSAGVAARGKRLETRPQEARLGKPALRLRHDDVGRNQSLVSGVVAFEQRDHRAGARIHVPAAGLPRGLDHVGRRLVAVVAVGHAADQRVLVRLLRQFRQQFADANAVHVGRDGASSADPCSPEPASGFGSKVSMWLAPPQSQTWMTDLALALAFAEDAAACSPALSWPPSISPAAPRRPRPTASRREISSPADDPSWESHSVLMLQSPKTGFAIS